MPSQPEVSTRYISASRARTSGSRPLASPRTEVETSARLPAAYAGVTSVSTTVLRIFRSVSTSSVGSASGVDGAAW